MKTMLASKILIKIFSIIFKNSNQYKKLHQIIPFSNFSLKYYLFFLRERVFFIKKKKNNRSHLKDFNQLVSGLLCLLPSVGMCTP